MTTITANLAIAGTTTALTGYIRVNIEASFTDTGGTLNLPVSKDFPLVSGAVSFDLDPSDVAKVAYTFEIWRTISDSDDVLIKSFKAIVPYSATSVNITDLATQIGVRYDQQDAALLTLARYLQTSDTFWASLVSQVWQNKGDWDVASYYKRGDVVLYNGSGYQYIWNVASVANLPTNTTFWRKLVSKGDAGTGTNGNNTSYGVSWSGQTDAPSRNAVYNIIQQLATTVQLALKADLDSPVLINNPTAPTQSTSDNSTRLATTAYVKNNIAALGQVPVGAVMQWFTGAAPTKWLLCDGRAVSRTTYAALFTLWGTTYGVGDGSTTFNLPDCRGRGLVGLDTMSALMGAAGRISGLNSLGATGGTSTKTLSIANLPSHNHGGVTGIPNQTPNDSAFTASGSGGFPVLSRTSASFATITDNYSQHTHTIPSQGSGAAFDVLNPYIGVSIIVYSGV